MLILLYVLVGIILIIIFLHLIAPKSYDVSREITIKRNLPEVFDYIKLVKNQDNWSPWAEKDPNMKKSYKGNDGEVGFVSSWIGNKDVGEGEQEITNIVDNKVMESQLRFLKPFKSTSDAYIRVEKNNGDTNVTWGFSGNNKFPITIMMLFMNMDKTIGKDFEYGLSKLKKQLEK